MTRPGKEAYICVFKANRNKYSTSQTRRGKERGKTSTNDVLPAIDRGTTTTKASMSKTKKRWRAHDRGGTVREVAKY